MCDPVSVIKGAKLIFAAVTGGSKIAQAFKGSAKQPSKQQAPKAPDEGLSDEERRQRLIAQMAAGYTSNTRGGSGTPTTGSVTLGR